MIIYVNFIGVAVGKICRLSCNWYLVEIAEYLVWKFDKGGNDFLYKPNIRNMFQFSVSQPNTAI